MGLLSVFKKALQFRTGIPNFLTAGENFKQLCYILTTRIFRCYSDSHIEPQTPKEDVKSLKLDRMKLALSFPVPYLCYSPE